MTAGTLPEQQVEQDIESILKEAGVDAEFIEAYQAETVVAEKIQKELTPGGCASGACAGCNGCAAKDAVEEETTTRGKDANGEEQIARASGTDTMAEGVGFKTNTEGTEASINAMLEVEQLAKEAGIDLSEIVESYHAETVIAEKIQSELTPGGCASGACAGCNGCAAKDAVEESTAEGREVNGEEQLSLAGGTDVMGENVGFDTKTETTQASIDAMLEVEQLAKEAGIDLDQLTAEYQAETVVAEKIQNELTPGGCASGACAGCNGCAAKDAVEESTAEGREANGEEQLSLAGGTDIMAEDVGFDTKTETTQASIDAMLEVEQLAKEAGVDLDKLTAEYQAETVVAEKIQQELTPKGCGSGACAGCNGCAAKDAIEETTVEAREASGEEQVSRAGLTEIDGESVGFEADVEVSEASIDSLLNVEELATATTTTELTPREQAVVEALTEQAPEVTQTANIVKELSIENGAAEVKAEPSPVVSKIIEENLSGLSGKNVSPDALPKIITERAVGSSLPAKEAAKLVVLNQIAEKVTASPKEIATVAKQLQTTVSNSPEGVKAKELTSRVAAVIATEKLTTSNSVTKGIETLVKSVTPSSQALKSPSEGRDVEVATKNFVEAKMKEGEDLSQSDGSSSLAAQAQRIEVAVDNTTSAISQLLAENLSSVQDGLSVSDLIKNAIENGDLKIEVEGLDLKELSKILEKAVSEGLDQKEIENLIREFVEAQAKANDDLSESVQNVNLQGAKLELAINNTSTALSELILQNLQGIQDGLSVTELLKAAIESGDIQLEVEVDLKELGDLVEKALAEGADPSEIENLIREFVEAQAKANEDLSAEEGVRSVNLQGADLELAINTTTDAITQLVLQNIENLQDGLSVSELIEVAIESGLIEVDIEGLDLKQLGELIEKAIADGADPSEIEGMIREFVAEQAKANEINALLKEGLPLNIQNMTAIERQQAIALTLQQIRADLLKGNAAENVVLLNNMESLISLLQAEGKLSSADAARLISQINLLKRALKAKKKKGRSDDEMSALEKQQALIEEMADLLSTLADLGADASSGMNASPQQGKELVASNNSPAEAQETEAPTSIMSTGTHKGPGGDLDTEQAQEIYLGSRIKDLQGGVEENSSGEEGVLETEQVETQKIEEQKQIPYKPDLTTAA